jgi:glycosyltransferase involved in cell wall biosynthesis
LSRSNPINIVAVVPYRIFPAKMGGQKGIALFYEYLSRLLNVSFVSIQDNKQGFTYGNEFFPLLSNRKSRYINFFIFFRLLNLIKKKKYTHIVFEHPYYGWMVILLRIFSKIKIIIHSHNIESLRFRSTGKWWWRILWQYEKMTHRMAHLNFFISDEDKEYGIKKFNIKTEKCITITYGIEQKKSPSSDEKIDARERLIKMHSINPADKIILFNGTLDYRPNLEALETILYNINPILLQKNGFHYTIIICGKNLPDQFNNLNEYSTKNIIYAGFVEDINLFFMGSDIFINPVIDGGGIKTKLVEALGFNIPCISSANGAIGIPLPITNNQLKIIENNKWQEFADAIMNWQTETEIGTDFFEYFYWGNIAKKAANEIEVNLKN